MFRYDPLPFPGLEKKLAVPARDELESRVLIEPQEKYKAEYAEVGNLRRHYSTVRSALTTFSLTAALAALANSFSQSSRPSFLVFVGIFMLVAALLACFVFSYRSEKAELYLRDVWVWFDRTSAQPPPQFREFSPDIRPVISGMCRDEMNWALLLGVAVIVGAFCYLK